MSEIYLDNASTTEVDPRVIEAMFQSYQGPTGNASSIHKRGVRAAACIEKARVRIARQINADPEEILFTSCGTESNHLALVGLCRANRHRGNHLIISSIEHPSILATADWLESQGFRVSRLDVDTEGRICLDRLSEELSSDTILVSIMHANNEVGTLQDVGGIGRICSNRGVPFHSDACQSFTKADIDVRSQHVDLLTMSAHKIHGPRGVAALFVKKGLEIKPLLLGGGQESGLRSGTYNTEGIIGFGVAAEISSPADREKMTELRDFLIEQVLTRIPDTLLNGPRHDRLCNNANFTIPGTRSKKLLFRMDQLGFSISIGSACSASRKTPSHVLLAMGRHHSLATESLRISLSKWTTRDQITAFTDALVDAVKEERNAHATRSA